MKLLAKTIIYYIIFFLVAFTIGGIVFYNNIRFHLYNELDDSMRLEKDRVIQKLMVSDTVPKLYSSFENQISINIVNKPATPYLKYKDTLIYDSLDYDFIPFRHLESINKIYTRTYKIEISRSLIKRSDLVKSIFFLMLFLVVSLFVVLILVNYFVSKRIWVPFYDTINKIKNYKISKDSRLNLKETKISEFALLNDVLKLMSDKINQDFVSLREFTENASHEIQTPLAIIKSKLELLIQSENLTAGQMKQIQDIYEASNRLSKLNQFLLLITKIDNLQFSKTKDIVLTDLIDKYLDDFEEIIDLKHITVNKEFRIQDSEFKIQMNPALANVLISNLLSNAIKHNIDNGFINIELDKSRLIITNTGEPFGEESSLRPEELFSRFKKAKVDSDSLGLGLSIVKKITELYKFKIEYTFINNLHAIKLDFNQ